MSNDSVLNDCLNPLTDGWNNDFIMKNTENYYEQDESFKDMYKLLTQDLRKITSFGWRIIDRPIKFINKEYNQLNHTRKEILLKYGLVIDIQMSKSFKYFRGFLIDRKALNIINAQCPDWINPPEEMLYKIIQISDYSLISMKSSNSFFYKHTRSWNKAKMNAYIKEKYANCNI